MSLGLGQAFTDDDNYQGTLLACAEAINSGITTVHDWSHNVRGPAHAEAELRALAEAGLRARYSYGYSAGHPNDQAMDLDGLRGLHRDWDSWSGPGAPGGAARLTLGLACRGPGGSNPSMRVPPGVYQREMAAARELGLPVTVHASGPPAAAGQIAALAGGGPARAGPAGGARQQREPGGNSPACGGGLRGEPVAVQRAADRLRAPADGGAPRGRDPGRPVRGHHRADRQRRHVRDHEADPGPGQRARPIRSSRAPPGRRWPSAPSRGPGRWAWTR